MAERQRGRRRTTPARSPSRSSPPGAGCWPRRPRSTWQPAELRRREKRRAGQRVTSSAMVAQVQADPAARRRSRNIDGSAASSMRRAPQTARRREAAASPRRHRSLAELKTSFAAAEECQGPGRCAPAPIRRERVPALDRSAAPAAGSGQRRGRASLADLSSAFGCAARAAGEVQTEGKLKPWLARHRPDGLTRPVDRGTHRGRLSGDRRWNRGRASASTRWKWAMRRDRARLRRRCASQAGSAAARRAPIHTRRCRASPELAASATPGPKALLNDWLEGVPHRATASTTWRWRAAS